MTNYANFLLIQLLIISVMMLRPTVAGSYGGDFVRLPLQGSQCSGSIAECMAVGEFQMESESTRRVLQLFLGINFLNHDFTPGPCQVPGHSYYNCACQDGKPDPAARNVSRIEDC
uniref:protein RALF-like 1 n=1 Tax=Erigeron canadensis TaxID=72917 RepID=UPI001CB96987|nr:protein RALF-like 1 [Erigeron canadensis]